MFQTQYQSLRPLTTAHLAQTMTMLSLNIEELQQEIDKELAANPALEMIDERRCPICHRLITGSGFCPTCSCPPPLGSMEPVVLISPQEEFHSSLFQSESENLPEEEYSIETEELAVYVLRQIGPELEESEKRLAAYLLTNLDEDGLLIIDLAEIADYFHIPLELVERVQRKIQRADPVGVGSCTTQEALKAQIELISETRPVPDLVNKIVIEAMDLLSHRQYVDISRKFGVSIRQVQQAAQFIGENLNPYPARSHWGDVRHPASSRVQVYRKPDIVISYLNNNPANALFVEIMMPFGGTLRVNPLFRNSIQEASEENRQSWREDLERASLFVKCLQQRNNTMLRLLQKVVSIQRDFIILGPKYLKPLTRVQLSHELEVHESTISRAVSGKTVQLPNSRIIPLSDFFDRSMHVRSILKDLILAEKQPLSDAELADMLSVKGFIVARRTVAKYRSMEGILPAHLRRVHEASR